MEKINDDIKQIHHSKTNKQTNNLSVGLADISILSRARSEG
jgi:hypothetical protein